MNGQQGGQYGGCDWLINSECQQGGSMGVVTGRYGGEQYGSIGTCVHVVPLRNSTLYM